MKPSVVTHKLVPFTHLRCKNDTTSGMFSTGKNQLQSHYNSYFDSYLLLHSRATILFCKLQCPLNSLKSLHWDLLPVHTPPCMNLQWVTGPQMGHSHPKIFVEDPAWRWGKQLPIQVRLCTEPFLTFSLAQDVSLTHLREQSWLGWGFFWVKG